MTLRKEEVTREVVEDLKATIPLNKAAIAQNMKNN